MPLRVGFISTANIGRKNALAIKAAHDVELVAVSSRSLKKAEEWAQTWGARKTYASHEELLADPDVDAVYIPLPTGVRVPFVIAAAKHGKHVLCEKPIAPNAQEAEKMIKACRENGVVFMDGVMFMHNKRLVTMKSIIKSDSFGEVKRVNSDFSFYGNEEFHADNIRGAANGPQLEPMGSLGDLGWYNVRLAMFAFDWAMPVSVSAVATKSKDGMPIDISCTLTFAEGKMSTFSNSYDSAFRQYAAIVGTKQTIELNDFCLSGTESNCSSFRVYEMHGLTEYDLLPKKRCTDHDYKYVVNQEVCMWEKFAELCKTKDATQMKFYEDVALNTQRIMDAVMSSAAKDGASVRF